MENPIINDIAEKDLKRIILKFIVKRVNCGYGSKYIIREVPAYDEKYTSLEVLEHVQFENSLHQQKMLLPYVGDI